MSHHTTRAPAWARPRPGLAALSGWTTGVLGTVANGLLAGFFALSPRFGTGNPLGPANDIVGSLAMAASVPALVAVGRLVPLTPWSRQLQGAVIVAAGVSTAAGPLLVLGVLPFEVSTTASILAFCALATWIADVCRRLGRIGVMPVGLARLGRQVVRAAVFGLGATGAGLLLPDGSPVRTLMLGSGVAAGATAWVAVPIWFWLVGSWLNQDNDPARLRSDQ